MRLGVLVLLAMLLAACSELDAGGAGECDRIRGGGREKLCRPAVEGKEPRIVVLGLPADDELVSRCGRDTQNFLKHS